ncbi:MAG: GNAT family N-acetyltransferase [Pseudomonadota bacterium]
MRILSTERLHLRTLDAADAPFYLKLVNDPGWLRHIGDKGIRTLDGARNAILEGPCAMQREHGFSLYLVVRRDDGTPMGLCGLLKRDSLPGVDIGYAIAPRFRGHGYTHEAACAVLAHARDTLRLPRLFAITGPDNLASNHLLQKLGLQFIEETVLAGSERPSNVYRIEFTSPVA